MALTVSDNVKMIDGGILSTELGHVLLGEISPQSTLQIHFCPAEME